VRHAFQLGELGLGPIDMVLCDERESPGISLANRPGDGDGGRVLDERARREIQRVRDLRREIDEADRLNDRTRSERAREELDQIVELLSGPRVARAIAQAWQRRRTRSLGRDVANSKRNQEDRRDPSQAGPASRKLAADRYVLRVSTRNGN
jgi:hypothetical protein